MHWLGTQQKYCAKTAEMPLLKFTCTFLIETDVIFSQSLVTIILSNATVYADNPSQSFNEFVLKPQGFSVLNSIPLTDYYW